MTAENEHGDTSNQHVAVTKGCEAICNDRKVTSIDLDLIYDHSPATFNDREAAFIYSVVTSIYRVATSKRSSPTFTHRETALAPLLTKKGWHSDALVGMTGWFFLP